MLSLGCALLENAFNRGTEFFIGAVNAAHPAAWSALTFL